ncbi:Glucose-methanol-choline oxidoreductase [Orpheovirus IHUMI-LCC2]|uniref:Glucose-methanol-choline oxidoreductase n=1 Tax=Orpheovirus IHUMI-LCC2 TaxID=2023057 RepID=A0A2I2L3I3_9VIRU|nr:Glucose-methanol-choline oxidoreductase [Orpheovirus IHUMI-LCC2]SNW62081.1 Glucose-methanol-choline oxidoreductase [Orpheovirus IHUMI-LCC2]
MKIRYLCIIILLSIVFNNAFQYDNKRVEGCDFIIAGAGAAGSVVAGRLAERFPCQRICLIERGPNLDQAPRPDWILYVDGLIEVSQNLDNLTEVLYTTPQPGLGGRVINTNVGAMVGGGGSRNAFGYRVPSRTTINEWNVNGWKFSDLEPEFRRVEKSVGIQLLPYNNGTTAAQVYSRRGFNEAGYRNNTDNTLNGDTEGAFQGYSTISGPNIVPAQRTNSYFQYVLASPRLNKNLFVYTYMTVQRVILSNKNVAKGVEAIDKNGNTVLFLANKEVIVTSGTYASSQILMLSGIGDAGKLSALGITPRINNPNVGKNLWYHWLGQFFYIFNPAFEVGGGQVGDISTGMFGGGPSQIPFDKPRWVVGSAQLSVALIPGQDKVGFVECTIFDLYSKGTVDLSNASIFNPPIINYNAFQDPRDINTAVQALGQAQFILNQPSYATVYLQRFLPDPSVNLQDPVVANFYARSALSDAYHTGGTTKMGNLGDNTRVVNPRAEVVGAFNLRVCDLSIIPDRAKINTYGLAMAVGSRCASIIIDKYASSFDDNNENGYAYIKSC